MPGCSNGPGLVTFRGGFVADWAVVNRLLDLERRGCAFTLEEGGRFRVSPPDRLTHGDVEFLRARRDEARRVIAYLADDSHLFSDRGRGSCGSVGREERT